MKRALCLFGFTLAVCMTGYSQDEGDIEKKERLERDKGIFVGLGPSFTLGKNIGDYSAGFNLEVGYLKRFNRVLSIGPSLSIIQFDYDPEETGLNNAFVQEDLYDADYQQYYDLAMVINFEGGDLTLVSAACNLKFNFIPVTDDSKLSVYGFAKPFLTVASRTEVKGVASVYTHYDWDPNWFDEGQIPWEANDPTWGELGVEISDKLKADTEFTGGIFIGPGVEIRPGKKVSVFAQAAFGYTFPITFVSTESYQGNSFEALTTEFPMVKKGFPSVNVQFGASFNF